MSRFKKMIQITMPTETNAIVAGCDFEAYQKRIISALDIDYEKLASDCEKKLHEFKGTKRIIRTGKGCELTMDTSGRDWIVDAGEGAFPCGEIYIAPIEEKTNGTIFFDKLVLEGGKVFEKIIFTIRDGHLIESNCVELMDMIKRIPEKGADVVAELGIGMNPNVKCCEEDSTLDEDALGTFHIALGMNVMFGGKNNCRFHMDFVTIGEVE